MFKPIFYSTQTLITARISQASAMGEEEATNAGYDSLYQKGGIKKGGFRATMFIFALLTLENMGFVANMASMILYFLYVMYFNVSGAANTLTNFMGSTFLLSLVGGFISDTYLSRFHTSLLFGVVELVGLMMVAIQAHQKNLQPEYCGGKSSCVEGKSALMLYGSLSLLALGSGGVRGALPALGADQFNGKDPKEAKALATYFNYLLLSTVLGAAVGVTVIVKVSIAHGWFWGFFISLVAAFIGFVIFAIGKPFYRIQQPGDSPTLRILQVIVVAIKNRKLSVPENPDELYEISDKVSLYSEHKLAQTMQFSCLDKAAIIGEGSQPEPWSVCTVTQVEEVKILTRMLPILMSTVIMNTCLAQLQTFSVAQGSEMYSKVGFYDVPAPSIPFIPLVFMAILIPIYEFVFVPFARKITNHPQGITQLQRVGVGLVLSAVSMAVAGIVEVKRKNEANSVPPNKISLFWLSFQYGIFGIADMFTLVGLLEFFYKEAPIGMRSLSTSFTWISLSLGYFLSTIFVNVINSVTEKITPSKKGWLHGTELNDNNLNLFYWFLAILSCLNFLNYLYWASWYKYKPEDSDFESKPKALKGSVFHQEEEVTTTPTDQDVHGDKINETSSFEPKEEGAKEKEQKMNETSSFEPKEEGAKEKEQKMNETSSFEPKEEGAKEKEQKMNETPPSELKEEVKEKEEQLSIPAA